MRDSPSFASNYERCSQTRKISIGVMVDSGLKTNTGAMKKKEVLEARKTTLSKEKSIEGNREWQGLSVSVSGKQAEGAPTISIRSQSPTAETVHHANQTCFPGNSGGNHKVKEEKALSKEHPSQINFNETVTLQAGNGNQKNVERVTYKRRKWVHGTADTVEGFSFATAQECVVSEKGTIEDKTIKPEIRSSEDLKKKLLETLGVISSPQKEYSTSNSLDLNGKRSKPEKVCDSEKESVGKCKQKSETTEPDWEDPDLSIRRAVTRSLARKRDPATAQQKKVRTGPNSHKQNEQGNDIFNFQEGLFGSQPATMSEKRGDKIYLRKPYFLNKYTSEKILEVPIHKKPVSPKKTSSLDSRMRRSRSLLLQDHQRHVKSNNITLQNVLDKDPVREDDTPPLPENVDHHKQYQNPSFKNVLNQRDDPLDPKFGSKSLPATQTSPSSSPKVDQLFTSANICSFKTWQISTPDLSVSYASRESSGDEKDVKNNETGVSTMKDKDMRGHSETPSLQGRDFNSSEDDSPISEGYHGSMGEEILPTEIGRAERRTSNFRKSNIHRGDIGIKFNELGANTPSPQGKRTIKGNEFCELSELNQDDGLSRAVTLFILALEKLQSKMKSLTMKKSSEILMSTADRIRSQIQNAGSQIQADVGKLTSVSKSKSKSLETKYCELQEKVKVIHEKFIDELNQQLQDSSSTFEKIEENKIELKDTIKKQKTSHRKLLLQVEKAIESQLNEAKRRITGVHKMASERMLELKQVIAECLMEGVLD